MTKAVKTIHKLLKSDHFLYLGFRSIAAIVNLLSIGLFVSWFGLESYGESALIIASASLILSVVGQWLINSINRFYYEKQRGFFENIWSYSLVLLSVLTAVLVFLAYYDVKSGFLLAIHLFILYFSYNYALEILRMRRMVIWFGICVLIEAGSAIFVGYSLKNINTIFNPVYLCMVASCGIPLLITISLIGRKFFFCRINISDLKEAASYGFPMSISSLFGQIIFFGVRYFLGIFFGNKEVGIFSALYDVSQRGATFILNTLTTTSQVLIFKEYAEKNLEKVNKIYNKQVNLIVQFSLIVAMLYYYAYPYILQISGSKELVDYKYMLVLVSIIVSINRLKSGTFDIVLQLEKKTVGITVSTLVGAFFSLIPGILLVKNYGIWGGVFSLLISYLASLMVSMVMVSRLRINYLSLIKSIAKKNLPIYVIVMAILLVSVMGFQINEITRWIFIFLVICIALYSLTANASSGRKGEV